MSKNLHTVAEVVEELGGAQAVKDLTKRASSSVVPVWKYRGKFPPNTFVVLQSALEARGLRAPSKLWGMS